MRRVTINRKSYALPFGKLFDPLTDSESKALRSSIELFWVQAPIVTFVSPTHGQCVLDGMNRAEIAQMVDASRDVPVDERGDMTDLAAEALAITLNIDRRQITPEKITVFRQKQETLAKKLRGDGKSVRAIATETGLPRSTVADLVGGVRIRTPEPDDDALFDEPEDDGEDLKPARVRGSDGKSYPATSRRSEPTEDELLKDVVLPGPKQAIFEKLIRLFEYVRRELAALQELNEPLKKRDKQVLIRARNDITAALKRKLAGKRA